MSNVADAGANRMTCAPLAVFAFNRPVHLARTLEHLAANDLAGQTPLIVFCDGARNEAELPLVEEVRRVAREMEGFAGVEVVERDENFGLARSIITGVTDVLDRYGRVIVVEDDLLTSRDFLQFMNQGLALYQDEEKVASIHGYAYGERPRGGPDSYFLRGADCWGWATWKRAWAHFEPDGARLLAQLEALGLMTKFDYGGGALFSRMLRDQVEGRNNSWAIRWHASAFLADMLTLYPGDSLVTNIGFDDSGTHCGDADYYESGALRANLPLRLIEVKENPLMRAHVERFFRNVKRKYRWNLYKRIYHSMILRYGRIRALFANWRSSP